jgi:hypothetical protein
MDEGTCAFSYIQLHPSIAGLLSHAVLFAACQPGLEHMLPDNVRQRTQNAWADIQPKDFRDDWNPIIQVPLLVSKVENQLVIDKLHVAQPDGPPQPQAFGGQQIPHAQALNGHAAQLQSCLNQIHHCLQNRNPMASLQSWMQEVKFATQVRNINRL